MVKGLHEFRRARFTATLALLFFFQFYSMAFGGGEAVKKSFKGIEPHNGNVSQKSELNTGAPPIPGKGLNKQDFPELELGKYRGKNLILFFYSIDDPGIDKAIELIKEFFSIRMEYNFQVVGLSINPDRVTDVLRFNQDKDIPFPVFFDHNMEISSRYKIKGFSGFFIYNRQGDRMGGVVTDPGSDFSSAWRGIASKYLKIGYVPDDEPVLGLKPPVPLFKGTDLNKAVINIKDIYQTKPVVIVIFSPKCVNCRNELEFLNKVYNSADLKGKFEIVAISTLNENITGKFVKKNNYSFPVIVDKARKIVPLFPSYIGSIPLSFIVDKNGLINALHIGFNTYLTDVYIMELKKVAGLSNPPLLFENGYSGEKRCGICHEKDHIQWSLTGHSDAFHSLVRKGKEDDLNCVPCHVTGFGKAGGYDKNKNTKNQVNLSKYLEGVQCESCHGPGYKSCSAFSKERPVKRTAGEWEKICLSCHTEKESLDFVFSRRFPKVVHLNSPDLSKMSRNERLKLISKYREKKNVFDNPARYVGAEACRECHKEEYVSWKKTIHAGVHQAEPSMSEDTYRYNTGVGSPGGYPEPGREGVQCEACHGPGEKHIAEPEAKGSQYIVDLGETCSSCVVEQICRGCHSLKDDPNFDFDKSIVQVRHKPNLTAGQSPGK